MNDLIVRAKHLGTPGHELLTGLISSSHGLTERGEALILGTLVLPVLPAHSWWPLSSESNILQPINVHRFRQGRVLHTSRARTYMQES
jgi:hypothetical protein